MSRYRYFWGQRRAGRVVMMSPEFDTQAGADRWGDRTGAERRGLVACRLPATPKPKSNPPARKKRAGSRSKKKGAGRVSFHGMFTRRADALERKRRVPGSRIEERTVRGVRRYIVMQQLGAPARNVARRSARTSSTRSNPRGRPTEIYAHLREIVATKGPGHLNCDAACKRARHTYRHVFTSGPPVLGAPDGSLAIPA